MPLLMTFGFNRLLFAGLMWMLLMALRLNAGTYDPLDIGKATDAKILDFTIHDSARNRDIPIRVYLPVEIKPEPVVLFSPGLGGSRETCAYLGNQWAARGYVVVALQHPGSDDSVWKGVDPVDVMPALQKAASLQNFFLRVKDVTAALDQIEAWNKQKDHALFGRLDMTKIGMSGHSFGAITTEAVSGESVGNQGPLLTDPRIKAAIAFSPSVPKRGDPATAFGSVSIPWMLMTGTKDGSPIGDQTPASRLGVFPNLRLAPRYQVVLFNAEHSAFTERPLPGDAQPRNPNHHRVVLALSTAFWDAYLRDDSAASRWLSGAEPQKVMEKEDKWDIALAPDSSATTAASSAPPSKN